jgi:hypothetical protein
MALPRAGFLATLLALAACGGAEDEANVSVPLSGATPAVPPAAVAPAQDVGRDAVVTETTAIPEIAGLPPTPGRWVTRQEDDGLAVLFGDPARGAVLSVRCDRADRRIVIRAVGAGAQAITIRTDRGSNLFEARPDGDAATIAEFPAHYPWFADVLATASGMMGVEVAGAAPLVVPADKALAQVVDDCAK